MLRPLGILRRDRPNVAINMPRGSVISTAELAEEQLKMTREHIDHFQQIVGYLQMIRGFS